MATWQPPIPSGALYSPAATALGAGLALLAWCYDQVERDGSVQVNLEKAAADIGRPYGTVRDWWRDMKGNAETGKPSPFFAEITPRGRKGWYVKFKSRWIDWRIVEKNYPQRQDFSDETENIAENPAVNEDRGNDAENPALNNDDRGNTAEISEISSQFERRDSSDQASAYKVLIPTDQADHVGALAAPPLGAIEPPKVQPPARGKRDPNQQHPACLAFFQKTGYRPNRQQAADISATVNDLDAWQVAIGAWLSRGNRINDAGGMLDWYLHPDRQTNARSNGHGKAQPVRPRTGEHFERAIWREARIEDVI